MSPPFIVARLSASLAPKQVLIMPYRIAKSCFDVKRSI